MTTPPPHAKPSEKTPRPAGPSDLEPFLDMLWMERGLSENTLNAYRTDLQQLAAWLESAKRKSLLQAERVDLLDYLACRVKGGAKSRSTARLLSSIKRFYQYGVREQRIAVDPSERIAAPKLGRMLPKFLSETEVESLINAPDADEAIGMRDRTMLEVLYATGLRVSELVNLQLSQINLRQGVIRVYGKGSKERLILMGEVVVH